MPYTLSYFVFYLVVLSQVLLLSFYLPRTVLRRLRRVIDEHPPSTYPKLYPMSIEVVERGLRRYRIMNLLILLAGLALVFAGIYAPSADMLNWDNQAVLALYACLQFSPMLLVERSGLKYYRLMRKANVRTTRRADREHPALLDHGGQHSVCNQEKEKRSSRTRGCGQEVDSHCNGQPERSQQEAPHPRKGNKERITRGVRNAQQMPCRNVLAGVPPGGGGRQGNDVKAEDR